MKYFLSKYLYILYSFVFILYIFNVFIDNEAINYLIGLLAILLVVVSFSKATTLFKILSGSFITIGGFFYFQTSKSFIALPSILSSNMSLLVLLAMLPWMNSVVRSGRFDKSINVLMKVNVSDLGKLYVRSSAITLTLTSFLNLSAASISQEVLKKNLGHLDKNLRDSFISISTLRGFSLALLWSPLEILLATTIFVTDVSYISLLPWLLLIVIITFTLDALWGKYYFKKYSYMNEQNISQRKINVGDLGKKISTFAIALILFLSLVILLGNLLDLEFILTVTLLIFPFSFILAIIIKRTKSFLVIGWNTWKEKTNSMQNFIILFISLSIFSEGINDTTFLKNIQTPIMMLSEYPLIVFFLIQIFFIFMSMFGVHPIATISVLGSLLSSLLIVYNPTSIAIVMITSSVATLTVGTYGLVVTLTAVNLKLNPYRITINNFFYSIIYGGIGSIIAYLLL